MSCGSVHWWRMDSLPFQKIERWKFSDIRKFSSVLLILGVFYLILIFNYHIYNNGLLKLKIQRKETSLRIFGKQQKQRNKVSTLVAHQIKQEGKDSSSNETLLEIFHHGELNAKVRRSDEDCNIFFKCRPDFFPVSLATGNILWQSPRMCINGFNIPVRLMARGLNVAVFDPTSLKLKTFKNFDTFADDSDLMDVFFLFLDHLDIVIITTHDEASNSLSDRARQSVQGLGSYHIQNLSYRDSWLFVGQKGIEGFSLYEQIAYSSAGEATRLSAHFCVQRKIKGIMSRPDPLLPINPATRVFCHQHLLPPPLSHTLCSPPGIDQPLQATSLPPSSPLQSHPIFTLPIIILPDSDLLLFRMQAESLLLVPGLQPSNVHVFLTSSTEPVFESLVHLYAFKELLLDNTDYRKALERAWLAFDSKYVIILRSGVMATVNLLQYFSTCLDELEKNEDLVSASAWSNNSAPHAAVNNMTSHAHSTALFLPDPALLIRVSLYPDHLVHLPPSCCPEISLNGWQLSLNLRSLSPHVSAVTLFDKCTGV